MAACGAIVLAGLVGLVSAPAVLTVPVDAPPDAPSAGASDGVADGVADGVSEAAELLATLRAAVDAAMQCDLPIVVEFRSELIRLDENDRVIEHEPPIVPERMLVIQFVDGRWRSIEEGGSVTVFDGTVRWSQHRGDRTIEASNVGGHAMEWLPEVFLQREGFMGWAALPTLADELRECEVREIELVGNRLRCVYVLPRERAVLAQPFIREVIVELGDAPRLVRFARTGWNAAEQRYRAPMINEVIEWASVDGRAQPRVAWRWRPGTGTASRWTLVAARVPTAEEVATWRFSLPSEPGWVVRDRGNGLEWTTGERRLTVHGRVYELDEPLLDHPGADLAALLREARLITGILE